MWSDLNTKQKQKILQQVSEQTGLPTYVIEKDWWVCMLLRAAFQSKYAESIIFKGGTSLSKAYQLIDRFSEDIDLIIDRSLLGFDELTSKAEIKKLRKASGHFIINEFREELIVQLRLLGIKDHLYEIKYNDHVNDMSDPNTLEIIYDAITSNRNVYIQQRVLLEMGARSLAEPSESRIVNSYIDEQYQDLAFSLSDFEVQVATPTKTFIEKVLLLHEEFSKIPKKIRTDRLTRHLYDLEKLMNTSYGKSAIEDNALFDIIVTHRKEVTPLRGMDYSNHKKGKLKIIPPDEVLNKWEQDYSIMQENMILGKSLPWKDLIERIKEVENRFNQ